MICISRLSTSVVALFAAVYISHAQAASRSDYINNALNAADSLKQYWYNSSNGQWQDLWWNSANMITTLANLADLCSSEVMTTAKYFFENTFVAAQKSNGGNFTNDFYDDEGWWAMAWIRIYDVMQNSTYLDAAEDIFADMQGGADATCGGHWWSKNHDANTAIGNELYISVAASLANRVGYRRSYYGNIATKQIGWFLNSGLINENNTINDSLNLNECKPTGTVFTYNQGVILGAMLELNRLTSNQSYLDTASKIAHGAIDHMTDNNKILIEAGYPGPLDSTSAQFKGVFVRNLAYLQSAAPEDAFVSFLQSNADAIWSQDQKDGRLGPDWQGPYYDASAVSHSSALDCIIAAAAVSS